MLKLCGTLSDAERRLIRLLKDWCCVRPQGRSSQPLSLLIPVLSVDRVRLLMLWRMSVAMLMVTTVCLPVLPLRCYLALHISSPLTGKSFCSCSFV